MTDGRRGRVAFRYPNFRYYMTARMLATVASEMQAVAVGWQIYALTHRALDLGLVGLAQFLPGILLFLVAGQTADRFPRQRILQCCYVAFAGISALLLGLTLRGLTSVWPVYAALVLNGVVRAFQRSGVAGVPAAGGAGRSVSERGGLGLGRVSRRDDGGADGGRPGLWPHRQSGAGLCRVGGGVPERHGVDGADPGGRRCSGRAGSCSRACCWTGCAICGAPK